MRLHTWRNLQRGGKNFLEFMSFEVGADSPHYPTSTFEIAVSNEERVQVKNLVILDRRLVADALRCSLDAALNEALGHPAMAGSAVNGTGEQQ